MLAKSCWRYIKSNEIKLKELGTFGHKKHLVVQEVTKITGNKRNVKILDVAAGTGICGELVSLKILARNLLKNNGGLSKWINLN